MKRRDILKSCLVLPGLLIPAVKANEKLQDAPGAASSPDRPHGTCHECGTVTDLLWGFRPPVKMVRWEKPWLVRPDKWHCLVCLNLHDLDAGGPTGLTRTVAVTSVVANHLFKAPGFMHYAEYSRRCADLFRFRLLNNNVDRPHAEYYGHYDMQASFLGHCNGRWKVFVTRGDVKEGFRFIPDRSRGSWKENSDRYNFQRTLADATGHPIWTAHQKRPVSPTTVSEEIDAMISS